MAIVRAKAGQDVFIYKNRNLTDFGDDEPILLDIPDDMIEYKIFKNDNTIILFKPAGKLVNITIKILSGSGDDKFLNTDAKALYTNPSSLILSNIQFIQNLSDENNNSQQIIYDLTAGVISKLPSAKENQAGDILQALAVYNIKAKLTNRNIV